MTTRSTFLACIASLTISFLSGCQSALESFGTSAGVAAITYVRTERTNESEVAGVFRKFNSQVRMACAPIVNAPEVIVGCKNEGGAIHLLVSREPSRIKFLWQMHPLIAPGKEEETKAKLRELSAQLTEHLKAPFGQDVE